MNNIDPVQYARQYLSELESARTGSARGNEAGGGEAGAPRDEVMWYSPDSKIIAGKPPDMAAFDRDIKKLQALNAGERAINAYCGLTLLIAIMAAVNAGAGPLSGPLFVGIASAAGKALAGREMENECGRKAYNEITGKTGISKDPSLTERLDSVGGKLLSQSRLEGAYRLVVLDTDEVNAHSLPGYLLVTKGMLHGFPQDGELALFIGHEIAHAEDRDALESMGQEMFETLALSSTLLKSKVKVEGTDKTVGDYRKAIKQSFYDSTLAHERDNEASADRRGAELSIRAGFSPEEAKTAIEKVCRIEEDIKLQTIRSQVYQSKGYYDEEEVQRKLAEQKKFDGHPDVAKRLEAVQQAIDSLSHGGT
jgi:hypothetical protein